MLAIPPSPSMHPQWDGVCISKRGLRLGPPRYSQHREVAALLEDSPVHRPDPVPFQLPAERQPWLLLPRAHPPPPRRAWGPASMIPHLLLAPPLPPSPSAAGCSPPFLSLLCSRSPAGEREQCLQQPLPTPQAARPRCRQAGYSQPAELRHLRAEGGVGYLSQRVVQHVPGREAIRKNEVTAPYICPGHNPVHGCGPAAVAPGPRSVPQGLSAGPWPHLGRHLHCMGKYPGVRPGLVVQPAQSSVAAAARAPAHPSRAATAT